MDTGLLQNQGTVDLKLGEVLRLKDGAGRHVGVVKGVAWITQDEDFEDRVLGAGESLRLERNGLTVVTPLGVAAKLVLEEGLVPERKAKPDSLWNRFVRGCSAALQARQTAQELRGLSDHILRDVGLRREQIDCVAGLR
jgi:uncharacterized protein YjiS (DUF1127 family)